MAQTALAPEKLFALRETIARLEGKAVADLASGCDNRPLAHDRKVAQAKRITTGIPIFDEGLQGGIPLDNITEIRSAFLRNAGASSGFALALCASMEAHAKDATPSFLWIGEPMAAMEAGLPYALGLSDFGLDPTHFVYATPRRIEEALWLAETGLTSGAFTAIILEIRGNPARFGLTESRRLSLKSKDTERPLLLLRQAGEEEASSAPFRLRAEPAPALSRALPQGGLLAGSIGNPVFSLTLEKSRGPVFSDLSLEWNSHERQFRPVDPATLHAVHKRKPAHSGTGFPASADRPDRAATLGTVVAFSRAS